MYLVMLCKILFPSTANRGSIELRKVHEISGDSSWKNMTSNCLLKLPARWYFGNQEVSVKDLIKKDDPIEVYCGYDSEENLRLEFAGFVSGVKTGYPVEIRCEDYMYLLKKIKVHKSYRSVSLKKLMSDILPSDIILDSADLDLGTFRMENGTVAKVLEKIKASGYGLVAFMRGKTLVIGKAYPLMDKQQMGVPEFGFEKNIKAKNLEFRTADDYKVKVTVISNTIGGDKIEASAGEAGGIEVTRNHFGIKTKKEALKIAQAELQKVKIDGYQGSFDTFGSPYLQHGDAVKITSNEFPENNGGYFIDSIKWMFNASGFTRVAELGSRAIL